MEVLTLMFVVLWHPSHSERTVGRFVDARPRQVLDEEALVD
jgi:hypothetical protein